MRVKRQFIETSYGQLHLRLSGKASDKPALLCLHMMPKSGRGFAKLLPELALDRLVLAPDYPGYGESDALHDLEPSIADYAQAILKVIQYFELSTVDLLGYHTGSMVAVYLAAKHPELVGKVINISAPVLTEQEADDFKNYFSPIPLDTAGTRFHTMWQRVLEFSGPGMDLEMAVASMAENLRGGERYEDGHFAAFNFAREFVELIEKLEQPIWVMNIADELHEYTRRIKSHLNDNGRVTDFPHWGNGCLELFPRDVADEVRAFLDQETGQKI